MVEDVSHWVQVNDGRTVWSVRNYYPWKIRFTLDRPLAERYGEFGIISPILDLELAGGQSIQLTLNETLEGNWVAEASYEDKY